MKTWRRATVSRLCGKCGKAIDIGQPQLELVVNSVVMEDGKRIPLVINRPLLRCVDCAGEPPPDLPDRVERATPQATEMTSVGTVAKVLDWKEKASGE